MALWKFWGKNQSNLEFYTTKLIWIKYQKKMKCFVAHKISKVYFPYNLSHEVTGGCVPPKQESKSIKRKTVVDPSNRRSKQDQRDFLVLWWKKDPGWKLCLRLRGPEFTLYQMVREFQERYWWWKNKIITILYGLLMLR